MSCPIELKLPSEPMEVISEIPVIPLFPVSPKMSEAPEPEPMECDNGKDPEVEPSAEKVEQRVDDLSDIKERSRKNSASEETGIKSDPEIQSDPSAKVEPPPKTDNRKRKRSLEHGTPVSDKENQRRSTRSRAYAQQVEEDIYSLRAELRSFLPTSLL